MNEFATVQQFENLAIPQELKDKFRRFVVDNHRQRINERGEYQRDNTFWGWVTFAS